MYISIRHKIAASLFASVFVLTLLINLFDQYLTYREFKEHIRGDAEASVTLAISQANRWFQDHMTAANLLGLQVEKFAEAQAELEEAFRSAAEQIGISTAYLGMDDGRFLSKSPEIHVKNTDYKESGWYQEAKRQKRTFFIGPYLSKATGKYTLTFGAPIYDTNRLFVKGAVGTDIPLTDLKKAVSGMFISEVSGLEVFPIKDGKYLIFVRSKGMPEADFILFKDRIQEGLPAAGSVSRVQKDQYLSIYGGIPETPLVVYYPVSLSRLIQPVIQRALVVTAVTTLGLFIVFQLVLMLMGRFVTRIEDLKDKAQDIAGGDFKARALKSAEDEIGDLADSFNQMASSLVRYMEELKETTRTKERLNREMELAAEIQKKALPESIPVIEGVDVAANSFPAYEVGGDYYDFMFPEKGKVGFVIADAAGKGFPGTLFMTNSRSVFRVISSDEKAPEKLLNKMNEFIATNSTSGMFITVLYCVYEISTKKLTCANAGHYAPLIYRKKEDRFVPVKAGGLPVGIVPGQDYEAEVVQLESGDILTLFTDGVVETMNPKKEMFEVSRTMQLIRDHAAESSKGISEKLGLAIKEFAQTDEPFDDMTLMVMKIL